jgi:4-hydroxy-4-methyl-2-oxoglutarate aldolase
MISMIIGLSFHVTVHRRSVTLRNFVHALLHATRLPPSSSFHTVGSIAAEITWKGTSHHGNILDLHIMTTRATASDPVLAGFAELGSSSISDALDRLGIPGHPLGIRPLVGELGLCGRAFTVRYVPVRPGRGETVGDFVDEVPPGAVVVIDNGGRVDATVWGDLMTTVAVRNGLSGTLIDGVCRDTPRARQMGYPIYARGTFMRTGKDRVTVAAIDVPVNVAEHRVNPEDIVFGDADGVVIVPADRAEESLLVAQEIAAAEQSIRDLLAKGSRLDEARSRFGYHQLQAKQPSS